MGKFFHGWRRKAGCATLTLTCLILLGWVRSQFVSEIVRIYDSRGTVGNFTCIGSMRGVVFFYRALQVFGARKPLHEQQLLSNNSNNLHPTGNIVPYWTLIPFPALLSAYLLFSRPGIVKTNLASVKPHSEVTGNPSKKRARGKKRTKRA